jgi:DNA-binding NtrC family response regulator
LAAACRFREDLYYRLSTVPIKVPPLRERKEDIHLLFRKFSADFAEKYRSKPIVVDVHAQEILINYRWPGNIRQLKNIAEQLSVLDEDKTITSEELNRVLPANKPSLPMLMNSAQGEHLSEREIFYKVLYDLRKDVMDLKGIVFGMMQNGVDTNSLPQQDHFAQLVRNEQNQPSPGYTHSYQPKEQIIEIPVTPVIQESLSLEDKEVELIKKSLNKHNGRRKKAAAELGISERTLYRKIKQYNMEE